MPRFSFLRYAADERLLFRPPRLFCHSITRYFAPPFLIAHFVTRHAISRFHAIYARCRHFDAADAIIFDAELSIL